MQGTTNVLNQSIVKSDTIDFDEFYGRPHQSSYSTPNSIPQSQEVVIKNQSYETLKKTQACSKIVFQDGHS